LNQWFVGNLSLKMLGWKRWKVRQDRQQSGDTVEPYCQTIDDSNYRIGCLFTN